MFSDDRPRDAAEIMVTGEFYRKIKDTSKRLPYPTKSNVSKWIEELGLDIDYLTESKVWILRDLVKALQWDEAKQPLAPRCHPRVAAAANLYEQYERERMAVKPKAA